MKLTIHAITMSISFDTEHHQEAAEMAASLVRECEWAARKINDSHQPFKPADFVPYPSSEEVVHEGEPEPF